jgi:hypothetical protein
MKIIHLGEVNIDLNSAIELARHEPLLLLTPDGHEFFMTLADNFDAEVESLRRSQSFQRFLDERSACPRKIRLIDIEAEIERELATQPKSD